MSVPGATISPLEATAMKAEASPVAGGELAGLPQLAIDEGDGVAGQADVQITSVIGVGGIGRIELGRQRVFGREIAVKRIRPDRFNAAAVTTLLRESRITGSLEPPNILPVHQLGLDGAGRPVNVGLYIVRRRDVVLNRSSRQHMLTAYLMLGTMLVLNLIGMQLGTPLLVLFIATCLLGALGLGILALWSSWWVAPGAGVFLIGALVIAFSGLEILTSAGLVLGLFAVVQLVRSRYAES